MVTPTPPTGKRDVRLLALPFESRPPAEAFPLPASSDDRGFNGLVSIPLQEKRGAWLGAVRGLRGRTSHSIEVERTPFDLGEARSRGGDAAARLYELVFAAASKVQKQSLASGEMSWAAFYRLAAKGVFGSDHVSILRYADLELRMKELGLDREFDAMLADLPRADLKRLRQAGIVPVEVFMARVRALGSWSRSGDAMTIEEVRAELLQDRRISELEALPPEDRARIESGKMTGVEVSSLLNARARENVDVLVIGAGAAGIGAADEALDRGLSVTVLEAKKRTGGRAFTEENEMGFAFDHGCAWIHEATTNPFLPVVEGLGFKTVPNEKFQKVFAGGDPEADASVMRERMEAVSRRWQTAANLRPDAKASMVSAPEHRLDRMAAEILGPLELALELDQFSVGEFQTIVEEKDDHLVERGLGNAVHAFSHGLPMELECPVEKIKWSADGVEVESNGRTFRAKQLILTVSPRVLEKRLQFDPPLPEWKVRAIDRLQMASFEKIALRFAPGTLDQAKPFERACGFDENGRPFELLLKPWGRDVALVLVGGNFAKELLAKPKSEAIDYALRLVTQHYGKHVRAGFEHGERTEWTIDPDILGTWAIGKPGAQIDRVAYAAPIENTLFIAGEACGGGWSATVNGAFFSGREVAQEIAKLHSARAAS